MASDRAGSSLSIRPPRPVCRVPHQVSTSHERALASPGIAFSRRLNVGARGIKALVQ